MHDAHQAGGGRRLWAAVPFKGPVGSKRRLATLLSPDERARLSLAMLDGVLEALLGVAAIERVLLLRPPTAETPWERGHSFAALKDKSGRPRGIDRGGQDGLGAGGLPTDERLTVVDEATDAYSAGRENLNGTLMQAQALAASGGADALLILPGDLPLVTASDLAAVLDAAVTVPIVIAPDRAGDGTNALLLAPPVAIVPGFGEASFGRHRALVDAAGLSSALVDRPGLALDLDTPADVAMLLASGQDCRAVRLLREIGVADRLETLASAQAGRTAP
jgi:2-phospho-L-lactate guanylyltransferase